MVGAQQDWAADTAAALAADWMAVGGGGGGGGRLGGVGGLGGQGGGGRFGSRLITCDGSGCRRWGGGRRSPFTKGMYAARYLSQPRWLANKRYPTNATVSITPWAITSGHSRPVRCHA